MKKIFEGVRVIDITNNVAGPMSIAMMADLGAEVIKIEKPVYGDDSRGFVPFYEGKSLQFMWLNRGKKSITLDMKLPEGKKIFTSLVETADVVAESFRPGVMARLGFDYQEIKKIKPSIIMCSASAFGQTGPYKSLPGYDLIAQAASGVMFTTGFRDGPPTKLGPSISDYACAFNAFGAIASALFYRERTGIGQYVDVSLAECTLALNDHVEIGFQDPNLLRNGNHHVMLAPYGVFNGKNGNIAVAAGNERLWAKLCTLMGKEEYIKDPAFDNCGKRVHVLDQIIEMIEGWLKNFDDINEAERVLKETGIPCSKITTLQDLKTDPHFLEREMIVDFPTPQLKKKTMKTRGNQIKFSETPAVMGPGPELGQHTEEILTDILNMSAAEIDELRNKGIFGPVE